MAAGARVSLSASSAPRTREVGREAAPRSHAPWLQSRRRTAGRRAPSPTQFRRRYVAPARRIQQVHQPSAEARAARLGLQARGAITNRTRLLLLNTTPRVVVFYAAWRVPGSRQPQPRAVDACPPQARMLRGQTAARAGGGSEASCAGRCCSPGQVQRLNSKLHDRPARAYPRSRDSNNAARRGRVACTGQSSGHEASVAAPAVAAPPPRATHARHARRRAGVRASGI